MENFTRLPSTMLDVLMDSKPVLLYPESNLPERYFEARALLPTLLSPTITTVQSRLVGGRIFLDLLSRISNSVFAPRRGWDRLPYWASFLRESFVSGAHCCCLGDGCRVTVVGPRLLTSNLPPTPTPYSALDNTNLLSRPRQIGSEQSRFTLRRSSSLH